MTHGSAALINNSFFGSFYFKYRDTHNYPIKIDEFKITRCETQFNLLRCLGVLFIADVLLAFDSFNLLYLYQFSGGYIMAVIVRGNCIALLYGV